LANLGAVCAQKVPHLAQAGLFEGAGVEGLSAFDGIIAHGPEPENEISLFAASGCLAFCIVMRVDMRRAVSDSIVHSNMTFEPLVQITGLSNVDRDPAASLVLFGVDVIARQRLECSAHFEDLVRIFPA
jgi:hypothetical protein